MSENPFKLSVKELVVKIQFANARSCRNLHIYLGALAARAEGVDPPFQPGDKVKSKSDHITAVHSPGDLRINLTQNEEVAEVWFCPTELSERKQWVISLKSCCGNGDLWFSANDFELCK
ncbi:hypothetical protein HQ571_05505 [Candidatus Kuenenbacteria bacterium]|nr:hypothetical protein [Candidatus Kuenenbacteria bacterium]